MGLKVLCEGSWLNLVMPKDVRSDLRGLIESQEDRMLIGSDSNLKSVQKDNDSLKEVLKQKMLYHEAIFRNQVHELHRLYTIQKNLMKDLSWNEFKSHTSWTANTNSTPLSSRDLQKHNPLGEDKIYSAPSVVGSTWIANRDSLECPGSYSKLQQTSFDLQLPADQYVSHLAAESCKKRNIHSPVKESTEKKDFLCVNHAPDPEVVELSLSTGDDTTKKGCSSRFWYNGKTCLSSLDVIDSEESVERILDEEVEPVSFLTSEAPTTNVGDKHGVQVPFPSDPRVSGRMRKGIGHSLFTNHSFAEQSESSQKWKSYSLGTGLNECHASTPFISLLLRKQQSSSHDTTHVDLNIVQLDESSCFSNDPLLTFPSLTTIAPGVFQGPANVSNKGTQSVVTSGTKTNNSYSDENSDVFHQDNSAYSALTDSKGKDCNIFAHNSRTELNENSGTEVGVIDLESVPEDPINLCKDFSNHSIKPSKENADVSLGLPNGFLHHDNQTDTSNVISKVTSNQLHALLGCTDLSQTAGDAEVGQVNCDKSEEDTVSSGPYRRHVVVQAGHCKAGNALRKTKCSTDKNLSRMKNVQSGTKHKQELEISNNALEESGATQLGSQVAETQFYEQDMETGAYTCTEERSSDGTKLKRLYHNQQQKEVMEMDVLVQRAAESLVHISLENSICSQDCFAKVESIEFESKDRSEQPQYSSDSFESITLRLTESSVDSFSVSSTPIELNETENGCRWKLKRGRRLKDFQKDILPGLVSLSRHEICEDMNIIEAVIKSKEFRENKSSSVGESWCVPVRSRRSKLNFTGRRNYS